MTKLLIFKDVNIDEKTLTLDESNGGRFRASNGHSSTQGTQLHREEASEALVRKSRLASIWTLRVLLVPDSTLSDGSFSFSGFDILTLRRPSGCQ